MSFCKVSLNGLRAALGAAQWVIDINSSVCISVPQSQDNFSFFILFLTRSSNRLKGVEKN